MKRKGGWAATSTHSGYTFDLVVYVKSVSIIIESLSSVRKISALWAILCQTLNTVLRGSTLFYIEIHLIIMCFSLWSNSRKAQIYTKDKPRTSYFLN